MIRGPYADAAGVGATEAHWRGRKSVNAMPAKCERSTLVVACTRKTSSAMTGLNDGDAPARKGFAATVVCKYARVSEEASEACPVPHFVLGPHRFASDANHLSAGS